MFVCEVKPNLRVSEIGSLLLISVGDFYFLLMLMLESAFYKLNTGVISLLPY